MKMKKKIWKKAVLIDRLKFLGFALKIHSDVGKKSMNRRKSKKSVLFSILNLMEK